MNVNVNHGFKKHKHTTLGLVLLLSFTLLAAGCQPAKMTSSSPQPEATLISCSFYPVYIMTRNIAGNIPGVEVKNMTQPTTGCLHDYQLSTEDLKNLDKAKFLVINGAGMESFMDKVASQRSNLKIIDASRGIELIKDDKGEANPHVWVSVTLAMREVQNIVDQLVVLDPAHADSYKTNGEVYLKKLEILKADMHHGLDQVPNKEIITFHEAFPYFAQEFNLHIAAVVEHEPGSYPSAGELADTVATIRNSGIKTIFAEPQYASKAAETIAQETGAQISYLDPVVSGPDDLDAYIKAMNENLKVLKKALGGE